MLLGIDIGGTNLKAGVFDYSYNLIEQFSKKTESESGFESSINNIISFISEIIEKHTIKAIGIGFPSVVNNGFVAIAPNMKGWVNIELERILRENINLPIYIDNDANVAALAELEIGAATKYDSFLYVTMGTGIGGSIVINKKLYNGARGGAGEIGHTIIDYKNEQHQNLPKFRQGILEEFIGRKQIIAYAKSLKSVYPNSIFSQLDDFDVEEISMAIESGDDLAIICFSHIGEILGIGLASVINNLDIENVVFGGGISQANNLLFDKALSTVKQRTLPHISNHINFAKAKFLNNAGIIGAAILANKQL